MFSLESLESEFKKYVYRNEDDVKIHFYSDIIKPILKEVNPTFASSFKSEDVLLKGGRTDATFQNISFEHKGYRYFNKKNGTKEALFGRDNKDHGLFDYILSNADINENDSEEEKIKKITNGIGVGFDGSSFVFARFARTIKYNDIDLKKTSYGFKLKLKLTFVHENLDFSTGLKKLFLLLKQQKNMH